MADLKRRGADATPEPTPQSESPFAPSVEGHNHNLPNFEKLSEFTKHASPDSHTHTKPVVLPRTGDPMGDQVVEKVEALVNAFNDMTDHPDIPEAHRTFTLTMVDVLSGEPQVAMSVLGTAVAAMAQMLNGMMGDD